MLKKIILFTLLTFLIVSCEDKEVNTSNDKISNNENYLLNLPSGVSWSDITSTILVQRNKTTKLGNLLSTYGISGDFYNSSDYAVDAGNVLMNGDTLIKTSSLIGSNYVYTYSKFDTVGLNQNCAFNVTGSSNYQSFTTNIQTPISDMNLTSISPNSNLSKGSNLNLTWAGTYQTDAQIRIVIQSSTFVFRTITEDDGNITIPSSALTGLTNGTGKISVYRTKFNLYPLSNNKYSLLIALASQNFDINITN